MDIYNKSKTISYRGFALLNSVPCGQCSECQERKANDYMVRTYYEWLSCIQSGGFVYFDTLTYNNKHLPKDCGIVHFSKEHIISFIKKLRVYLRRKKFRTDFKYFITSEYGGLKHRPHYHLLIFNYDPRLTCFRLWYFIHKSWIYGFTDVCSKAPKRVLNNRAALSYVAKYIVKDQEYQTVIDKRIEKLASSGLANSILKHIDDYKPFHLQSNGLGADVLSHVSIQQIFERGALTLPDKLHITKDYCIPQYILRKLFYYTIKREEIDKDGNKVPRYSWHLTELGIQYKKAQLERVIDKKVQSYQTICKNLPQFHCNNYDVDSVRALINNYLDGRSLRDFCIYILVYRNKTLGKFDTLPDYKYFFDFCLNVPKEVESHLYDDDLVLRSSCRSLMNSYKIDQYSYRCFRNFDDLYNLFNVVKYTFTKNVDDSVFEKLRIRDRLKLLIN